jgi:GNAT superfamily N-acetyltransferase
MFKIRKYRESDAISVGILIHDTYSKFNLSFASPDEQKAFLGPFQHARSDDQAHRDKIAQVIRASMVFVAENDGEIVGVLRGRVDKMQSLFVSEACHRQGVGRKLVERFEQECLKQNASVIKLMGTLYATPFYQALGYKKSTGVRSMRTFDGVGLPYQPMKKILSKP